MGIQGVGVNASLHDVEAYVKNQVCRACPSDVDYYVCKMKIAAPSTTKSERYFLNTTIRYMVLANNAKANNGKCKCVLCGRTIDDGVSFHVDNIRPIAKNGKTEMHNLQVLCSACNIGKSDLIC